MADCSIAKSGWVDPTQREGRPHGDGGSAAEREDNEGDVFETQRKRMKDLNACPRIQDQLVNVEDGTKTDERHRDKNQHQHVGGGGEGNEGDDDANVYRERLSGRVSAERMMVDGVEEDGEKNRLCDGCVRLDDRQTRDDLHCSRSAHCHYEDWYDGHRHHHHRHRHHHHHHGPGRRRSRSRSPSPSRSRDLSRIGVDVHRDVQKNQGPCNDSASTVVVNNGADRGVVATPKDLPIYASIAPIATIPRKDLGATRDSLDERHGSVVTPTRKVVHESTLLSLRPGISPRSLTSPELSLVPTSLPASPAAAAAQFFQLPTLGPIIFGTAEAKGLRAYMEDRHVTLSNLIDDDAPSSDQTKEDGVIRNFAAVYDGHNGSLAADHAQARVHHLLREDPAIKLSTGSGPPAALAQEEERVQKALIRAFEQTDKEILERCRQEGGRSGATGVVVMRIGQSLYAAHCGDSRAVMCRSGEPLRLTEDHKPNLPRERKRVESVGGRVDFARCWRVIVDPGDGRPASGLAVSRSFGDPDFKEPLNLITATPDVMREQLEYEDSFFILASDGLWDVMTDKEACDIVYAEIVSCTAPHGGSAEQVDNAEGNDEDRAAMLLERSTAFSPILADRAAEALVRASLEAGTMDNVTAVVGLLQWSK